MKKLPGKLAKTARVLGLAVAALTAVSAAPAAASTSATAGCTKYYKLDNVQVQVDNCSDGWVWIYTGDGTYYTGSVRITDSFGPRPGGTEGGPGQVQRDQVPAGQQHPHLRHQVPRLGSPQAVVDRLHQRDPRVTVRS
ncbi:hypothetical protein [Streptomyces sp. NPDC001843]|uniref:hypothetical protein n=1 Tax=Streptomyces sp. NPDC001843 TaxID=3364617 RepID=UPI003692121B